MRQQLVTPAKAPGFIGLIHREDGDEIVPRYADNSNRDNATVVFRRDLEPGETIRAVIPLATIIQLGTEAATAFRPNSQFELEDLMYVLDNNDMADLVNLGDDVKKRLGSDGGVGQAETGPFKLTGLGDIGNGTYWHDDEVRDAETIANLFEEAMLARLIEIPTANGSDIALSVGVVKGCGHYIGQDTCLIRMYCEEWDYLASEVMPASPDNFGMAIARAGCERGPALARELILMALEYANTVYKNLGPHLNEQEKEAAGIAAVAQ